MRIEQTAERVLVDFACMNVRPTLGNKPGAAYRAMEELLGQFTRHEREMILLNLCVTVADRDGER